MKLIRFGENEAERPGILRDDGSILDVSSYVSDYDREFFEGDGLAKLRGWLDEFGAYVPAVEQETRLGTPVANPSKIICIGLNFLDHCKELNDPIPTEPVLFTKAVSALTGPYDPIEIPIGSTQTDWEVELAVVISQRAKNIAETEAMDSIAGFTLMNDVSERDFQKNHGGQWVKGKSHDTFAPLGPWLVTPDEFGDVYSLTMNTTLNGEGMQQGSTGNMVFKVPFLISYISRFMTLLPGDVISTGTPPGVGAGKKPPRFLRAGDRLEMRIDGLGGQVHEVIQGA